MTAIAFRQNTGHDIGPGAGDDIGDVGVENPSHDLRSRTATDPWVAVLAHELRGPLGAVLMSLDELRPACDAEPDARLARESAERGSRQMARVIEDVLELCRGGLPPAGEEQQPPPADVPAAVAGAVAAARPLMTARGHQLSVRLCPRLPAVEARGSRLEQVLTNLLVNAAKFTDPGGHICLTAEATADGGTIVMRVSDDGIGMSSNLLPRVFDAGRRGPASGHGDAPAGLGLGLALVKSLVELHGGTVTAHSQGIGHGSEFVVRLPARRWPC